MERLSNMSIALLFQTFLVLTSLYLNFFSFLKLHLVHMRSISHFFYFVNQQQILITYQMNKKQQQLFAAFFQQIYQTQQLLDFIKHKLVQSRNYNPNLLFYLLSNETQKITILQMRKYLQDKIDVSDRELYEIFQRFDWTRQGFISRQDFLCEIQSFSYDQQISYGNNGTISAEIQGHFLSLIIEIIQRFQVIEVARKQIKSIQPYDAFEFIGYLKIGHIGIGQLRKLFFDNDFNVTDHQLYYLLHGLRRRTYQDIKLEAFCENLDPLEHGEYAAYQFQIDKQKQKEFNTQNRYKEQTIKRSRLKSQRIEHQFQKSQRKKQAVLDRQAYRQKKASMEMQKFREETQRKLRKAQMQDDMMIRYQRATCQQSLRLDYLRNKQDRIQNQILNSRRYEQQKINKILAESAFQKQQEIQRSRRHFEREISILNQETIHRKSIRESQAIPLRQLEFSKKSINQSIIKQQPQIIPKIQSQCRKIYNKSASRKLLDETPKPQVSQTYQGTRRKYQYDLSAKIQESNCKQNKFETSRTRYQTYRKIEKESKRIQDQSRKRYYENSIKSKYDREKQLSEIIPKQFSYSPIQHNLSNDYEKDIEQTRRQIDQRRKRRMAEQTSNIR